MATITVRAYLNTTELFGGIPAGFLTGYEPSHELQHVFTTTVMATADDTDICEQVFTLLNIGDDPDANAHVDPRAVAYRQAGHRSLSKGDVVTVADRWYSVDSVGFSRIDARA